MADEPAQSDKECSRDLPHPLCTDHLYYNDTYLFSCESEVLLVMEQEESGKCVIILNKTVMHPQGGIYTV